MSNETQLGDLGRAYRQLRAPRGLAPRILAAAGERVVSRRAFGLPLAAAATVVALMVLLPYMMFHESESTSLRPTHIPLSRVQGQMPAMSSFDPPSLGDIQGLPAFPSRHDMSGSEIDERPRTRLPEDPGNPSFT